MRPRVQIPGPRPCCRIQNGPFPGGLTPTVTPTYEGSLVGEVILFGAGASYGSGPAHPQPPPLGNELFHLLTSTFPGSWGAISGANRKLFEESVEFGMGALLASGSHDLPAMMQQFVVLFSSYQLRPGNAYSLLIGRSTKLKR